MERYLGAILIIILTLFAKSFWQPPAILGTSTPSPTETLPVNQPIHTESSFTEKLQEETEILPKTTVYQDDPETEAGEEKAQTAKKSRYLKSYTLQMVKNTPGKLFPLKQL